MEAERPAPEDDFAARACRGGHTGVVFTLVCPKPEDECASRAYIGQGGAE